MTPWLALYAVGVAVAAPPLLRRLRSANVGARLQVAAWLAAVMWFRRRAQRRRHAELLDMVGRPDAELGVTVLDHQRAAAYCLPDSGSRIVVTSGLLDRLTRDEPAARAGGWCGVRSASPGRRA